VGLVPLHDSDKADEARVGDTIELDERIRGCENSSALDRFQVDFNHQFTGRLLIYDLEITKKLDDDNERLLSIIKAIANEWSKIKV